jgi:MarR family transcriptional regulator, organic hydroperoxide resistance regulator
MNALRRFVRALRSAESQATGALGVSAAQLFVLREIDKSGALTVRELAARTATGQSSVSEVVGRLAARGLVARGRAPADRRCAAISLSDAGRSLLTSVPETLQERMVAAFGRMPAHRQQAVAAGLTEWLADSGLSSISATMFFEPGLGPG